MPLCPQIWTVRSCRPNQHVYTPIPFPHRHISFGRCRIHDDTGLIHLQDPDNVELLLTVLDSCSVNDHFWVFFAATTDVEFTVTVTDTQTDTTKQYFNPLGTLPQPIQDTDAFATCPASSTPSTPTLTPAGIEPSGLQISVGQQVLIVNQSSVNRMIQADPHPFHTACPPLNDAGVLGPGDSGLTGTFATERTCGFHDHLNPTDSSLKGQFIIGSARQ